MTYVRRYHEDEDLFPVGRKAADRVWRWLDKPQVGKEQTESWPDMLYDRFMEYEGDEDDFFAFLRWVCLENEYTVANLRCARDPVKSLTQNQWDNCVLRWGSHKALLKAQERKRWKNGPCIICDEAESQNHKDSACAACTPLLNELYALVGEARSQHKLFCPKGRPGCWFISDNGYEDEAVLKGEDWFDRSYLSGLVTEIAKQEHGYTRLRAFMKERKPEQESKGFNTDEEDSH